jgi:hypothetical protein
MRYTLGQVFFVFAMLSLALAGMTYRTSLWSSGIWTVTWLLFLFATMKAVGSTGRNRITSIAFAVAGVAYLASFRLPVFAGEVMVTNQLLAAIARVFLSDLKNLELEAIMNLGIDSDYSSLDVKAFFTIGHCIFAWIVALLAAWFAGRMYDRREQKVKTPL